MLRHIPLKEVRFILHLNAGVNQGCDTLMIKNKFPNAFIYAVEGDFKKYQSLITYVKDHDNILTFNEILLDYDFKWFITLDTLFKKLSIPNIDILYISYDNNILEILKGGVNTLKKTTNIILVESPNYSNDEVQKNEFLCKNNFKEFERMRDEKKKLDTVFRRNMLLNDFPIECPYMMKDDLLLNSMKNMNIYDYIHSKQV